MICLTYLESFLISSELTSYISLYYIIHHSQILKFKFLCYVFFLTGVHMVLREATRLLGIAQLVHCAAIGYDLAITEPEQLGHRV